MNKEKCDLEIFKKGEPIVILAADSEVAEAWVQMVANEAKARLDWHYSGGRAQVLHLGNAASWKRAVEAINKLEGRLKESGGRILRDVPRGGAGLYREGVTRVPRGTVAVDPELGPIVRR